MTGIDDLIGGMYKSDAQYLVDAGCRDIKKSFESGIYREENFKKGEAKLRDAYKRDQGNINLAPLVELGYERLRIINSGDGPYRVFELAKELGAQLDEERIRQDAYHSIGNLGTEALVLMEKHLSIKPDPQEILRQVYMNFDRYAEGDDPNSFWPRSFDALFYAVSRGGEVDKSKLPDKERFEKVIQYELEPLRNTRKALEYLRGFDKLGLPLATPETIATLGRIAELER